MYYNEYLRKMYLIRPLKHRIYELNLRINAFKRGVANLSKADIAYQIFFDENEKKKIEVKIQLILGKIDNEKANNMLENLEKEKEKEKNAYNIIT